MPRMTRYEEAFFPLENQEKKASRFVRLIIIVIVATLWTHFHISLGGISFHVTVLI